MKKLNLLLLACILNSSCATNKIPQFQNALLDKSAQNIHDIPLGSATEFYSNELKGKLDENDFLINFDNIPSSYDLYKLSNLSAGQLKVTVKSYCDCLGFSKYMAVPNIALIDKQKNLLPINEIEKKTVEPSFGRLYYQKSWSISISDNDEKYLIVGTSNKDLGEVAASMDSGVSVGADYFYIGGIKVRTSPYGEYSLILNAPNN